MSSKGGQQVTKRYTKCTQKVDKHKRRTKERQIIDKGKQRVNTFVFVFVFVLVTLSQDDKKSLTLWASNL